MPVGPGNYDDLATLVREQANAAGVVVIVFGGAAGSGVSIQADPLMAPTIMKDLPRILRYMADEIEVSG